MTRSIGFRAGLLALSMMTTVGGVARADETRAIRLAAAPVLPSSELGLAKDGSLIPLQVELYGVRYAPRTCLGDDCRDDRPFSEVASMLPMGAFLVTIDNTGDQPIVVRPKDFTLAVGNKTDKAFASEGDVGLRWQRTLQATFGASNLIVGSSLSEPAWAAEDELAILDGKVTIAPHTARMGYVVFDVGAYTPAEYAAALKGASHAQIQLHTASGVSTVTTAVSEG